MSEFKKRLKELGKNTLFFIILFICAGLIAWGIAAIPSAVANVIADTLGGIVFLIFFWVLLVTIWKGIYWLLIEPFRNK